MAVSYNGWSGSPGWSVKGGQLQALVVAGEPFSPGVRAGDVHTVFEYLANQLHARVEPVVATGWHQADDWGYSYRANRNANNLSCHSSGTAIDYNATRHPNGKRGTWTLAQVATVRAILRELSGVVRWGEDFTGTADGMHFEIIGTPAQVATVAARLRGFVGTPAAPTTPPAAASHPSVGLPPVRSRPLSFQKFYNATPFVPALLPVIRPLANNFGPQSEAALKKLQAFGGTVNGYRCTPLVADGIDGRLTKAKLWSLGWRG